MSNVIINKQKKVTEYDIAPREIVVCVLASTGETLRFHYVKNYKILDSGVLQFTTDDRILHSFGPTVRWNVAENLD